MDKQRTSGQVDRALYDTVVRRYFAEKSAREELQRQLQEYRNPVKADDLKFIKGILCYLNKVFLPYSTKEGVAMLYRNIKRYHDDFPSEFDASRYLEVWASPKIKCHDLGRMFWGINKAIGYKIDAAGKFLKAVFPIHFCNANPQTISSNLTREELSPVIEQLKFNRMNPKQYFEMLYDKEHKDE